MTHLIIDGTPIQARPGTTVMEAALAHGIDIPRLCYHPELSAPGSCRLCMVEVNGDESPQPGCALTCQDGMEIRTRSPRLAVLRREVLELLVHRHPLDCMVCEKSGACQLQDYAYEYGLQPDPAGYLPKSTRSFRDNPFFVRDMQYCILCGRCVRVCSEVVGANAIAITGRGAESRIATAMDIPMAESGCVFCGSCVQVCPTAALMPVSREGRGREWTFERVRTICGYCGVGCEIEYALKDGKIVYAQGTPEGPVNGEMLCTKGRFGWDFAGHRERLADPLLRRDVAFGLGLTGEPWTLPDESALDQDPAKISESHIRVPWDTALDYIAGKLAHTVRTAGPDAVMGLSSARCTNEENYLFQKFMRAGIGTNNVDHCARL